VLTFYHVYGSGKDPYCIESIKILDGSGYEYALTFLDKSPNLAKLTADRYDISKFPLIVECDTNGGETVLGSYSELKVALEYSDDCKECKKNKQ
jgi:hypothetical protein